MEMRDEDVLAQVRADAVPARPDRGALVWAGRQRLAGDDGGGPVEQAQKKIREYLTLNDNN